MIDIDVFIDRFAALTPEEKSALDAAITPEVGAILLKVMPELQILILPLMQEEAAEAPVPAEPAAAAQPPAPVSPMDEFARLVGGQ